MHPLDNVIWSALTTRQAHFSEGSGEARKFVTEISPLAGFREPSAENYDALRRLVEDESAVGVFLAQPYREQRGWSVIAGAPLLQMVCEDSSIVQRPDAGTAKICGLGVADSKEMVELAALTKPGPFNSRTHEFGAYFGIRSGAKLVAMAGERMRVEGHTEVSAVCTHPDHLGHGYASALMIEAMRGIYARGETPFLHVRGDNDRAIAIYERLGFRPRWRGHFAVIRKIG